MAPSPPHQGGCHLSSLVVREPHRPLAPDVLALDEHVQHRIAVDPPFGTPAPRRRGASHTALAAAPTSWHFGRGKGAIGRGPMRGACGDGGCSPVYSCQSWAHCPRLAHGHELTLLPEVHGQPTQPFATLLLMRSILAVPVDRPRSPSVYLWLSFSWYFSPCPSCSHTMLPSTILGYSP
ncbi:hypothetical protein BC826DRAFT_50494 [Russula brevipes]|nr:hypothetical protein BC826DRAFT_50494 [Russula brevipes]